MAAIIHPELSTSIRPTADDARVTCILLVNVELGRVVLVHLGEWQMASWVSQLR